MTAQQAPISEAPSIPFRHRGLCLSTFHTPVPPSSTFAISCRFRCYIRNTASSPASIHPHHTPHHAFISCISNYCTYHLSRVSLPCPPLSLVPFPNLLVLLYTYSWHLGIWHLYFAIASIAPGQAFARHFGGCLHVTCRHDG